MHKEEDNRLFWNIVKGISIISIVIGHTCSGYKPAIRFVYMYHLAIFFFVSGFLFSEDRYGDAPHLNFAARIRSSWPKHVGYMMFFTLLHNFFLQHGLLYGQEAYSKSDLVIALVNTLTGFASESMGGALWFVPVLIVASGLFGVIIYAGRKAHRVTGQAWLKPLLVVLMSLFIGYWGVCVNMNGMRFRYHIQTSLLVIPLFTLAWLIRSYLRDWKKYVHWFPGLLSAGALVAVTAFTTWNINLSDNKIISPWVFYGVSLVGIYFCLALAKYLQRIPFLRRAVGFLGEYSFDIMAGHFLFIKIVDVIYARIINETDPKVIGNFPHSFGRSIWWVYLIVATFGPALLALSWAKLKNVCLRDRCLTAIK